MLLETSDDAGTIVDGAEGQIPAQLLSPPAVEQRLEHLDLRAPGLLIIDCTQVGQRRHLSPEFQWITRLS